MSGPRSSANREKVKGNMEKPETIEEYDQKLKECLRLLIECRDALPAISVTAARLHHVSLTLADRIEACLEPWKF